MNYFQTIISSPIGELIAVASLTHLVILEFADSESLEKKLSVFNFAIPTNEVGQNENPILTQTQIQLREYFTGTRKTFDIPLAPEGTEFQKSAWKALIQIPYGETRSYKEEAILALNPRAVRAIGGANNKNPIVIIIPCHRVIGKDGSLVGYGGGIERKIWLLKHEKQK